MNDDAHLWTRMWLWRPKVKANMQFQMAHGMPAVKAGVDAALCHWSCASVKHCWQSSSILAAACLVRVCQEVLWKPSEVARGRGLPTLDLWILMTMSRGRLSVLPWTPNLLMAQGLTNFRPQKLLF